MFDEKPITSALAELGYRRLKRRTYKASWSSEDVEHFCFPLYIVAATISAVTLGQEILQPSGLRWNA